jgi:hypothetical protein
MREPTSRVSVSGVATSVCGVSVAVVICCIAWALPKVRLP